MNTTTKRIQTINSLKHRIAERKRRREGVRDLEGRLIAEVTRQLRAEIREDRKQGRVA